MQTWRIDVAEILELLAKDLFIREHERELSQPRVDQLYFKTLPDGTPDVRTITSQSENMMRGAVTLRWTEEHQSGDTAWRRGHGHYLSL